MAKYNTIYTVLYLWYSNPARIWTHDLPPIEFLAIRFRNIIKEYQHSDTNLIGLLFLCRLENTGYDTAVTQEDEFRNSPMPNSSPVMTPWSGEGRKASQEDGVNE